MIKNWYIFAILGVIVLVLLIAYFQQKKLREAAQSQLVASMTSTAGTDNTEPKPILEVIDNLLDILQTNP